MSAPPPAVKCPRCQSTALEPAAAGQPRQCRRCRLVFLPKATAPLKAVPLPGTPLKAVPVAVPASASPVVRAHLRRASGSLARFALLFLFVAAAIALIVFVDWKALLPEGTMIEWGADSSKSLSDVNLGFASVMTSGADADITREVKPGAVKKKMPAARPAASPRERFPRRMLAISINNYMFANPVAYGANTGLKENRMHVLLDRLARYLLVDASQFTLISDSAPQPIPPIRPVLEEAITQFCQGSRPQDRIILLFVGHAVEVEGVPYLVPLEGETDNRENLIPLSWVYHQLAQCRARQKVLVLDVCRYDPTKGQERPDGGPMGEKLDAALQAPPAGVQVLTFCTAGQYSYEFRNGFISGGVTLSMLPQLATDLPLAQRPEDPLPLAEMTRMLDALTRQELGLYKKQNFQQNVRLSGSEPKEGAPYDPAEPLPAALVVKVPASFDGGVVPESEIERILSEIDVPPLKLTADNQPRLSAANLPRFAKKVMNPYLVDEDTPLKAAVLQAVRVLRDTMRISAMAFPTELLVGGNENQFKERILAIQKDKNGPAFAQLQLTEALELLEQVGRQEYDKEPSKRWRANYDYVRALILARLAYIHEHNYKLGELRRELPPREGAQNGYRLASQERLTSGKEARDYAKAAQTLYQAIARDHPGTPWALLAKRERNTALGLRWEAAVVSP